MIDTVAAQSLDHVALLPAYLAAGTAVVVLLVDLFLAGRGLTLLVALGGALATATSAVVAFGRPARGTLCAESCSYLADSRAALVALLFALLTAAVLGLSAPSVRAGAVPAGEYCFLLACSMTGGVVLGAAGDLITLIVALETLTLPLYILVGSRRSTVASAEAAVTFFVVSVVSTAVALLGAALLYVVHGAVHLDLLADLTDPVAAGQARIARVAVVLLLVGLAFKVAAVPLHAWAPATYDGAPLPIAAYLSTASKLGGVVAIVSVVVDGLGPWLAVSGPVLALLAVLTMTVGNLVALRQARMVRLLAWSSVAQAGYLLAPLGAAAFAAGRTVDARQSAVAATLAYTVFYVVLELAAFAAVVALRPAGGDGGPITLYAGAARRRPWVGAALVLALVGLAGLPPGLAGMFAKVVVVRSLLGGAAGWLALVVAVNAVIGLVYYLRLSATLYAPAPGGAASSTAPGLAVTAGTSDIADVAGVSRVSWPVATVLGAATLVAVLVGFAPQTVFDAVAR